MTCFRTAIIRVPSGVPKDLSPIGVAGLLFVFARRGSNPERVSGGHMVCRWHAMRREVRSGCAARTADARAAASLRACQKRWLCFLPAISFVFLRALIANQASLLARLLGKGPAMTKRAPGTFCLIAASGVPRPRRLHIVRIRTNANAHSFRRSSFPHTTHFVGLVWGPHSVTHWGGGSFVRFLKKAVADTARG